MGLDMGLAIVLLVLESVRGARDVEDRVIGAAISFEVETSGELRSTDTEDAVLGRLERSTVLDAAVAGFRGDETTLGWLGVIGEAIEFRDPLRISRVGVCVASLGAEAGFRVTEGPEAVVVGAELRVSRELCAG